MSRVPSSSLYTVPTSSTSLISIVYERYPGRVTSCCGLYILGLGILTLFSGFASSPHELEQYHEQLPQKNELINLNNHLFDMEDAYQRYYSSKGWFSCDYVCTRNYELYTKKKNTYDVLQKQHQQKLSNAKANLGIFSETAIEETKDLFTKTVNGGTRFVTTQTKWNLFYSLLFRGISWTYRQDDGLMGWIVDMIFQVTMNVIMGTFGVVVSFAISVWSIITEYQASFLHAVIFYTGALLAVLSFGLTICFGCCGIALVSVASPAYILMKNRLENNGRYQQPERYYLHPHSR